MNSVGIIGFGRMGSALAKKLLSKGYRVVGWNRTIEKARLISGVEVVSSPRETACNSDVVLIIVSDDQASERVLVGEDGVFQCGHKRLIFNLTTVTVTHSRRMYELARERGFDYYEAPVLGGPRAIQDEVLVTLLGGDRDPGEEVMRFFKSFSKSVYFIGEPPKAMAAKLAFNSLFFTVLENLGEALALASSWGVETEVMRQIAMDTWTSAIFNKYYDRGLARDYPVGFTVKLAAKDLAYAVMAGERRSVFTPSISSTLQSFISAIRKGCGENDYASIIRCLIDK